MTLPLPRARAEVAPGAVHVPDWLAPARQREILDAAREWSRPPAGMRQTVLSGGRKMSIRTVCLGWYWSPYRYTRVSHDGTPVKALPAWLAELGRDAVAVAYGAPKLAAAYEPDIAVVNYYDHAARLGMHQDKEEISPAPVVSLSIGDTCVFRLGGTENRNRPWAEVLLESGDLFVFGGRSRLAFHGVPRTLPGTAPGHLDLSGRVNITLRMSGLS
ncbi:alpha-ketoglutarate-dependent dioxygenase AlkB family protein [Phytomonospora endophytica]|uniref:Alkylated DNA repair protein (DNA oxidative demethylase) n=1 Tax=Phytomonospora endophytica TaxID=714109 RepID=A0A841FC56_9ACTN|nr:alpha-ketoglutarate-dependent dioxygenase AlkB [Phytomonospora endophytica]MBB6032975.1 alkylated DNA repair protein (DNA oxidative demethylase) [Phytomonospora endophytica]GIG65201.1 alkylated DNA repair protein [Phytomonospora endophytica]